LTRSNLLFHFLEIAFGNPHAFQGVFIELDFFSALYLLTGLFQLFNRVVMLCHYQVLGELLLGFRSKPAALAWDIPLQTLIGDQLTNLCVMSVQ